jgi:4-hydroxythreonine-4-phosphate dehydrogenase
MSSLTIHPHSNTAPWVLSVGDATGIGPELALQWLQTKTPWPAGAIIIAPKLAMERACRTLGLTALPQRANLQWLWQEDSSLPAGQLAYNALETAVSLIAEGRASALVTGPISKANLWAAGLSYNGHTEILQMLANRYWPQNEPNQAWQADMLFLYKRLRVMLLTRHVPLAQVSRLLEGASIERTARQMLTFLAKYEGLTQPKLAFLGVNPHAGEIGGLEEANLLQPLAERLLAEGAVSKAPILAADAAFRGLNAEHPPYDAYLAAYHDQGLIPVKALGGWQALNVTVGLPFLRVSVSHGMAQDLVGTGKASCESLSAAITWLEECLLSRSSHRLHFEINDTAKR